MKFDLSKAPSRTVMFLCMSLYVVTLREVSQLSDVVCDPNCATTTGCTTQGAGKCDSTCKPGYSLYSDKTCVCKCTLYMYLPTPMKNMQRLKALFAQPFLELVHTNEPRNTHMLTLTSVKLTRSG